MLTHPKELPESEVRTIGSSFRRWMIFLIVLIGVLGIIKEIYTESREYRRDLHAFRKDYQEKQKQQVRDQIDQASVFIQFIRNRIDDQQRHQVHATTQDLWDSAIDYCSQADAPLALDGMAQFLLNEPGELSDYDGCGFYFVASNQGEIYKYTENDNPSASESVACHFYQHELAAAELAQVCHTDGEGYFDSSWLCSSEDEPLFGRITFVKYLPVLDCYIGSGVYHEDAEQEAQALVSEWIGAIRFHGGDGYLYVIHDDGTVLVHADDQLRGRDLDDVSPVTAQIMQKLRLSVRDSGSGYLSYLWKRPIAQDLCEKIAYAREVPEWSWIVGSGVYMPNIDNFVAAHKRRFYTGMMWDIGVYCFVTLLFISLGILVAKKISRKVDSQFSAFGKAFGKAVTSEALMETEGIDYYELKKLGLTINDILNSQRRSSKELRTAKATIEIAIAHAGIAVWELDLETEVFVCPEMVFGELGYPDSTRQANSLSEILDITHPEDREMVEDVVGLVRAGKQTSFTFEVRLRTYQGNWKWYRVSGIVLDFNEDGRGVKMVGIQLDIDSIKRNEQRLQTIFSNNPVGMWRTRDNRFEQVNAALAELLGYASEDALLSQVTDIEKQVWSCSADRKHFFDQMKHGSGVGEYRMRRPDGAFRWIEVYGKISEDSEGCYAEGGAIDITRRRESRDALEQIWDTARIGQWNYSPLSDCVVVPGEWPWCGCAQENSGKENDKRILDFQEFLEFLHPGDRKRFDEEWRNAINDKVSCGSICFRVVVDDSALFFLLAYKNEWDAEGELLSQQGIIQDITEIREIEQNAERARFAIDSSPDLIYFADLTGKIVYGNKATCSILNTSPEQIDSHCIWELDPGLKEHWKAFRKQLEAGRFIFRDSHFHCEDGRVIPIDMRCHSIQQNGESFIVFLGHDLTEKNKTDEQLRQSEVKYRSLYENSVEGICHIDSKYRVLDCNRQMADMFGYSREEILDRRILHFSASPERNGQSEYRSMMHLWHKHSLGGEAFEWYCCRSDQSVFCTLVSITPFVQNGEKMYQASFQDISIQRRLITLNKMAANLSQELSGLTCETFQERLGEALQRLSDAYEARRCMLVHNGCWNQSGWDILGHNSISGDAGCSNPLSVFSQYLSSFSDNPLGLSVAVIEQIESMRHIQDPVQEYLRENALHSVAIVPVKRNNEMAGCVVLEWPGRNYRMTEEELKVLEMVSAVIGHAFETIEYRSQQEQYESQLHDSLEKMRVFAEEAQSASHAKSDFLANMSHEIRTPLNAVLGFSEMLAKEELTSEQNKYVNTILTSGKSLLSILNDILDLSKIESGKLEISRGPLRLNKLADEVQQIFSLETQRKGIEFSIDVDSSIPSVILFDEVRLRQIIINLVGNAVKFTDRGFVRVTIAEAEEDTGSGKIALEVVVEDSGIGIPYEQQNTIFESFTQVQGQDTARFGGTGLGLTICKKLAQLMNGNITLQSEPGNGTEFRLCFREIEVLEDEPQGLDSLGLDIASLRFSGETVLVVDDEPSNRMLIKAMLRKLNLTVVEACDGCEALEWLEDNLPDMILTDIRMPIIDGWVLARTVKSNPRTARVPLVVLTASARPEKIRDKLGDSLDDLLFKPVHSSSLAEILVKHLCNVAV